MTQSPKPRWSRQQMAKTLDRSNLGYVGEGSGSGMGNELKEDLKNEAKASGL